jgi:hypothetical protein
MVERHIIQGLKAVFTLFTPMIVAGMSEEEISDIVSEPPGIARKREYLKAREDARRGGVYFQEAHPSCCTK